jgi:hypothetical protein
LLPHRWKIGKEEPLGPLAADVALEGPSLPAELPLQTTTFTLRAKTLPKASGDIAEWHDASKALAEDTWRDGGAPDPKGELAGQSAKSDTFKQPT